MSSELEQLRAQLQEEQRLRAEEQRLREEERADFQRQVAAYASRTSSSALPEFLDACHTHLYAGLRVQPEKSWSTQGQPANAENKIRPRRILPWIDFSDHQMLIWDTIMASDFVFSKRFTSIHTLEETGRQLRRRQLGSELDLHYFTRAAMEEHVASIIECLGQDAHLQQVLNLRGSISFENHGNMLQSDELVDSMQELAISGAVQRRRSPRSQPQAEQSQPVADQQKRHPATDPSTTLRSRADTFCVYTVSNASGQSSQRWPALIMELKAPHKLTMDHIGNGLKAMDVDDIVQQHLEEDAIRKCERLVAAVITQAFSYMIQSGLETGCIVTGEAFIFLRVREDDPSSVYYSLAAPQADVGSSTGWTPDLEQDNRLHLTAVGQLLAFTLRAIQGKPRSSQWRRDAAAALPTWKVTMELLEEAVPKDDVPASEYKPRRGATSDPLVGSPISRRLRRRLVPPDTAVQKTLPPTPEDSDEDDHRGPINFQQTETPSRASQKVQRGSDTKTTTSSKSQKTINQGTSQRVYEQQDLGPYCTSSCLKGLVEGGKLDLACPNARSHGHTTHQLSLRDFQQSVNQLLKNQLANCEELYINGATGVLYRLRLPGWNYTVVAKGTTWSRRHHLIHEAEVYERLQPIQGRFCPVYLGSFSLDEVLWYAGVVPVEYLMVMSYGGQSLIRRQCPSDLIEHALEGLKEMHKCGVMHRDIAGRNILYDQQCHRVTWHDFNQSVICGEGAGEHTVNSYQKLCKLEMIRARAELKI